MDGSGQRRTPRDPRSGDRRHRRGHRVRGQPGRGPRTRRGDPGLQRLVEDTGFDAVDAGTIAESWRQQMGTPAWCTELTADQLREALGLADREAAPKRRDAARQIISTWQDRSNFEDWLRLYRAIARFPVADDRAPITMRPRSLVGVAQRRN